MACYPRGNIFHLLFTFTNQNVSIWPNARAFNAVCHFIPISTDFFLMDDNFHHSTPFANITHFAHIPLSVVPIIISGSSSSSARASRSSFAHKSAQTHKLIHTQNIYECMCPLLRAIPFICCICITTGRIWFLFSCLVWFGLHYIFVSSVVPLCIWILLLILTLPVQKPCKPLLFFFAANSRNLCTNFPTTSTINLSYVCDAIQAQQKSTFVLSRKKRLK